jgi:Tripartite tricarboxylate transporter TctB family
MRRLVHESNKDYFGGALMFLIGVVAIVVGRTYPVGTLGRMGPGFFPVALGVILALAGLAIATSARFAEHKAAKKALPPEWRGWICICLSIVAFVVLGKYGGLVPATFAIVFISAMADRQNTIKSAIILALAIVAICIAVFWWALQMQFPLFGWG